MSSELAAWLRQQREDRGWTRSELAQPVYRGSAQARGLAEQVAGFAPDELGRLPGREGVGQA